MQQKNFIKSGRCYIFGHDTLLAGVLDHRNFNSLSSYVGVDLSANTLQMFPDTEVVIKKRGIDYISMVYWRSGYCIDYTPKSYYRANSIRWYKLVEF